MASNYQENIFSQRKPPLHKGAPQEMDVVAEVARQILEEALEEAKTEPEVKTTEAENEVTNDVVEQDGITDDNIEQNDSKTTQENTEHETIEVQVDIENVDEPSLTRNLSLVSSTQIINQYLYSSFENFINQTTQIVIVFTFYYSLNVGGKISTNCARIERKYFQEVSKFLWNSLENFVAQA